MISSSFLYVSHGQSLIGFYMLEEDNNKCIFMRTIYGWMMKEWSHGNEDKE